MVGYAKRKKIPMIIESKIVTKTTIMLCHLSEIVINFSSPSTIFIAGNAMKTSITIEKTRVSIMLSNFNVPHNSYE